ncbi:DNA polymerase III subunit alpha [Lentibacillus sp. CBA3610]|uniref:DNA polymerase III subunit alpha n=1 Tax=Lentibacillus sp. CBA3610 TaxID=2518176 RepID=UPI0015956058|nr:DNA polymerase III subunit alpha [Lentibacillus sp. CBA3610]QKY69669.1 DNA polymerase III subunit alpha [Lentibacillus sp. CBA3610]
MSFTHLQVHSGYSFLNSTITVDKLAAKAHELQFDALALTDEHVLYGAIPFYKACQQNGIKPIIGMSAKVTNDDEEPDACILLAKNNQGYQNLIKLSTHIQVSQKNSIEKSDLTFYSNDLICILVTSDSKAGTLLLDGPYDQVKEYLDATWHMFDREDFYMGVQDHGMQEERNINQSIKAFNEIYQTKAVLLNDVRYLNEKDDIAFDCLRAMKHNKKWPLRITNSAVKQRHLRSAVEMEQLFINDWPEIIHETSVIAEKCRVSFDFDQRMLPSYPVPEAMDAHTYLERICRENVRQKYDVVTEEVEERLAYELDIIQSMQFSDYFLIVWDFIAYAKEQTILVGPGRGSAAGSLVAYVLGITEVDPIQYDLLFERFLNPERVSMPDIDIDFSDNRRDDVIDYVRDKYGHAHVAQIITFGTFAARSLLRELIKTMDVDQQDAYFILKEIPVQASQPIAAYVKNSEDLQQYIKQSEKLKALFTIAAKLEGLPRHLSTHAAGVVISEEPLEELVPLTAGTHDTYLTQYAMNDLEAIGLLKMDFLGLRNLTLLERILRTIRYTRKRTITLADIPEEDVPTYKLLQKGRTNGVFQLESQGMKQVLTRLKPTTFEDIVAVNALFRPGPMENIPVYIDRKHGTEKVEYPHPDLEPILEKTYGVLIYQEQIMQIAHKIAGFSLGQADILRRAVSKKQQNVMTEQKAAFIQGCVANGYTESVAEEMFQWIVKFSNYGFNRSHAVAYSKISYQLAYLKTHYPASFFAELMSSAGTQQDKTNMYMKELKTHGLELAPPSINKSFGKYSVENEQIRMGFLSIKGIGNQVVNEIIDVRKDGPFKSLFDFCLRVSLTVINRRTLEILIMAGAFDELYDNRASLLASIDQALEQGELFKEFSEQSSLFHDILELEESYVPIEDFTLMKKLSDEKELLGIYVSSHPLNKYRNILKAKGYVSMSDAPKMAGKRNLNSTGIVQAIKTIRTKRGDPMAFLTIGDETGDMEAVVFPDLYRDVHRWLAEEMLVTFTGKVESRNNQFQWLMSTIALFDEQDFQVDQNQRLFIKITAENSKNALAVIKNTAEKNPGQTPIIIYNQQERSTYKLSYAYLVHPDEACLQSLRNYFGSGNVVLDTIKA